MLELSVSLTMPLFCWKILQVSARSMFGLFLFSVIMHNTATTVHLITSKSDKKVKQWAFPYVFNVVLLFS